MKIISAEQIRKADSYSIEHEPIKSINLMERAANSCYEWICENLEIENSGFHIFCGIGNNGGDGLVIARLLAEKGCRVNVYILRFSEKTSPDFETNLQRLDSSKMELIEIHNADFKISFSASDVVIDAVFGTGLHKPISGWMKEVIQKINFIPVMIVAIDIPSGLFSEFNDENDLEAIVRADITLTFQQPKLALLLESSGIFCGEWNVLDIGLNYNFIEKLPSEYETLEEDDIWLMLKEREKFQHKGHFGHGLIISGSKGMMGAAVLSSKACMRSGIGLLTTFVPACGYNIIQTSVPEAMCLTSKREDFIDNLPDGMEKFSFVAVGPGIGRHKESATMLTRLLDLRSDPVILDADALNIISENKELIKKIPKNSILSPHPGEFKRLAGDWKSDKEKLQKQIEFSKENGLIVVLKGAHTSISDPEGRIFFNTTGNPGMATAGSGDVLLGMITALLTRGYDALEAAMIGVYLHGLSGDLAAYELGEESMNAGDIIEFIPEAFLSIE